VTEYVNKSKTVKKYVAILGCITGNLKDSCKAQNTQRNQQKNYAPLIFNKYLPV